MNKALISFRSKLGLTVKDMADKIGISASYYEKIEYGDRNPSFNFITAFKRTFPEVNVDEIFFGKAIHVTCDDHEETA